MSKTNFSCPYCGKSISINKKTTCKYCALRIELNQEGSTMGEAQKVIIICKK